MGGLFGRELVVEEEEEEYDALAVIDELREAFLVFDTRGDQQLREEDLAVVMRCLGHRPSVQEVKDLIATMDTDGKGAIDFCEFLAALSQVIKGTDTAEEIEQTFRLFDRDGDGFITRDDLRQLLKTLDEEVSEEDVEEMMVVAGKERLSVGDFRRVMAMCT